MNFLRRLLHPCGPFNAFTGTISCGCAHCGQSFESWRVTAHRESTTHRIHIHCPHCQAIRLVSTAADRLRPSALRHAPLCAKTPDPNTRAWYAWSLEWTLCTWFTKEGKSGISHEMWLHLSGQYYILVPTGAGTQIKRVEAPSTMIDEYHAHLAMWKALDEMVAGRLPDADTRAAARRAGLDIRVWE